MPKMRYLFVILLSLVIKFSFAQEPLQHEKKFYVDENGRFYINKALPLYLWISTSPAENSDKHKLESESAQRYTNPFYFDTEGYNTIRTPSKVDTATKEVVIPREDIIFEVYADSKSPKTKTDFGETPMYTKSGTLFCGKNTKVELPSEDALSGVEQKYYSINGEPFKKYQSALSFEKEIQYTLKYYAVDNVGNPEKVEKKEFTVDITAPASLLEFDGDKYENIFSGRSNIKIKAEDKGAGVEKTRYQLDDEDEKKYVYPLYTSRMYEGEHKLKYHSTDNVENQEATKTYDFFVDKTAPIVIEEIIGDQFLVDGKVFYSGRTKLKLTAVDNKAGVKSIYYSIDGGKDSLYKKPFYLPDKSKAMRLSFYAVDNVNNKSQGKGQSDVSTGISYVDLTGPNLKHDILGPAFEMRDSLYISPKTRVRLKGYDTEAGMKKIDYSIDKGELSEYGEPFSMEKQGQRQVDYIGYDNVNNSNSNSFNVVVDAKGPEVHAHFSMHPFGKKQVDNEPLDEYPDHVIVYLSATDNMVGCDKILYSINGGYEKKYLAQIDGFRKGKTYTLKVRAFDKLGNENSKEFRFTIAE